MTAPVTREGAISAAGRCIAEGYELLDSLPVAEAARRAYTPTGPSIEELEERIRARRLAQGREVPDRRAS